MPAGPHVGAGPKPVLQPVCQPCSPHCQLSGDLGSSRGGRGELQTAPAILGGGCARATPCMISRKLAIFPDNFQLHKRLCGSFWRPLPEAPHPCAWGRGAPVRSLQASRVLGFSSWAPTPHLEGLGAGWETCRILPALASPRNPSRQSTQTSGGCKELPGWGLCLLGVGEGEDPRGQPPPVIKCGPLVAQSKSQRDVTCEVGQSLCPTVRVSRGNRKQSRASGSGRGKLEATL